MMYYPLLEEARILAASGAYRRIPVSRELLSDFITPIQALRTLRAQSGHCFLLESAADSAGWGRYTFLGFDPTLEITCKDGVLRLRDRDTARVEIQHPASVLRKVLAEYRSPHIPGLPPFTGGLVGYFAYDYLKYAEPCQRQFEIVRKRRRNFVVFRRGGGNRISYFLAGKEYLRFAVSGA